MLIPNPQHEDDSENVWMARETEDNSMTWIIDSGASRHMTPDESFFTSKRSVRTSVTIASSEKLYAQCIGNVAFDMEGQTIRMKDILYVPDLDANLLSISALNRNGLSVLFQTGGVEIQQGTTLGASGILRGKMYLLHTSLCSARMLKTQVLLQIF